MHSSEQAARAARLCRRAAIVAGAGLLYAVFVTVTGWAIPCPFHLLTGLYCPACGVGRMCLALLRLDIAAAWQANALLVCLLPGLACVFAVSGVRYIKSGVFSLVRWQSVLVWLMIALLLVFGVLRNLPPFAFLAPA